MAPPDTLARGVADLSAAAAPDGGFAARPGLPANTESTALAVWALHAHGAAPDAVEAGRAWLRERQRPDGAWSIMNAVPDATWATPLAALALARFPDDRPRALRAAHWLLEEKARGYPWWMSLYYRLFPGEKEVETDLDLRGWPWTEDTATWVEPSAYALVALKTLAPDLPRGPLADRLEVGERLLRNRMCPGGGWNYGNASVLRVELEPFPDTTALGLLAVRDLHPDPMTESGLARLRLLVAENPSRLVTALAALCFRTYGLDAAPLLARLRSEPPVGSLPDTRVDALVLLALDPDEPHLAAPLP